MNTAPKQPTHEKKRDRALYARLVESYQADRVGIFVDFDRLNTPRSPLWSPWENVAPLLMVFVAALTLMFTVDLILGTAVMVLGVFFYLFIVRPWIAQRVYRRAIAAATENLHNWNLLWKLGGLVLTLNFMNKTRCVSPDGDWRAFVTRYLPEMELDGVEAYHAFNRMARGEEADDAANKGPGKGNIGRSQNDRGEDPRLQDVHM
ncbi:MAG: hypothetical protein LCH56_00085 [Proteobacteria bacterium]|nr:hypothetical protein [Pseudomonadota bacterium]